MYKIQKRRFGPTRNSGGYPDGPPAWSDWWTVVEFENKTRAEKVLEIFRTTPSITTMKVDPNVEYQMVEKP